MPIATHACPNNGQGARYQESLYGIGRRVVTPVNKSKQDGKIWRYRCTCCGSSDIPRSSLVEKL
jgi:hypothetical protein